MLKRNIPNAITCGNLLCGCLAIVQAFEGHLVWAAYLVGLAAVLDFFDGFVARLLGVSSPIGKDLDSLADVVTFGVVPGIIIFNVLKLHPCFSSIELAQSLPDNDCGLPAWLPYISFMIPVFSAVRLARFNNDPRQSDRFIGLPVPANAIFFCSFPLMMQWVATHLAKSDTRFDFLFNVYVMLGCVIVFSFLLVAPLPLIALKFKNFGWADNKIRYIFLLLSVLSIACFQFIGIPLVIVLYILVSVLNNLSEKKV